MFIHFLTFSGVYVCHDDSEACNDSQSLPGKDPAVLYVAVGG